MFSNSAILITGGTGSFGKQFISDIFTYHKPRRVVIYSRDEFKQDLVSKKFRQQLTPDQFSRLRFFIGDVRDKDRMYRAFSGIDYVIHAAAMKQVPACEYNPFEAIKTNIHGAQNVIDAAIDCGVKKVVALSTDKAVNPINLYGGTKLVSDKLFISANSYSGPGETKFSVVRYGNVAGSRGSVIPFFKSIIDSGETELPITDFAMSRFWITLDEGVSLVFKAMAEANGGETYISKIPSFKITDLAEAMLPGCTLKNVGIREGEKLHEVMVTKDDWRSTQEYEKHFIIYPQLEFWTRRGYQRTPGGQPIQDGFEYNSGTNTDWLSVEDLKDRLSKLHLEV